VGNSSLIDFLGLIDGTDAIRYWDDFISNWADITGEPLYLLNPPAAVGKYPSGDLTWRNLAFCLS
jgi:hypothetical protein